LKNSFQEIPTTKFVRKLLNVRSRQMPDFAEITALVPFSTATGYYDNQQDREWPQAVHLHIGHAYAHQWAIPFS